MNTQLNPTGNVLKNLIVSLLAKLRFGFTTIIALFLVLDLAACGKAVSKVGEPQVPVVGKNSIVTALRDSAPANECPNGGISVDAGIDSNSNGKLDPNEVTSTQYVCDGGNGVNALVAVNEEAAGRNCVGGGNKIDVGNDINGNGILDGNEISSSNYVCNGTGITWKYVSVTSVQAMPNTGYIVDNPAQVTITLPATPMIGDVIQVNGIGAGGWKIAQNTGQSIITKNLPGGIGAIWTARDAARNWYSVASSSDGVKLVAADYGGQLYTSSDSGVNWIPRDSARNWRAVASSYDGTKLVAAVFQGQLFTSTDSGANWTAREAVLNWYSVASSADGTKLVAVVYGGYIYTSSDSGAKWIPHDNTRNWISVASSADGTKLVAAVYGGQLYTSTDSGANWLPREIARGWGKVASSADGTKLLATVANEHLYTSTTSGNSWIARDDIRSWAAVASSADGAKLVATVANGQLYTSTDYGAIWTARGTNQGWISVASSSDGSKLVAAAYAGGQIFTSEPRTPIGLSGALIGGQYDAIALQYIGQGTFNVLSHEGNPTLLQ